MRDKKYSLARVVNALVEGKPHGAEYEWEVSEMLRRANPATHEQRTINSILVPTHELVKHEQTRDLTVVSASAGGYLVDAERSEQVVHFLRGRSVVGRFGATILPGLRGDLTLPKIATGASHTWLSNETTQAAEQTPTTAQIVMRPKNVSSFIEFSRQLLLQSNVDVVLGRHFSDALAAAVDQAALSGSGASGQPTGLTQTSGVNAITGASLAWSGVLDFIVNAGTANLDVSGFAMTPAIYKLLANREKFAGAGAILKDGAIDARPALHSTSVPTASLLGGPWSELWIGDWGAVEIAFDPFTKFSNYIIGVRAMFSLDIAVRYPTAFSYASSIT